MEYIDGVTLLKILQERGPLPLREAREIASQFLGGLEAIHKAGLVHRDVKPENVMITRAGRVVLMDFGLAKPAVGQGTGTVSGTPAYMAPEHLRPYPGLASFTEADAEYFFGRELEVEALWRRLRRPHLLALIGPSGAGKSSFLRAGLIPALPQGWRCVVCTPGSAPLIALARAIVPELSGDTRAIQRLLQVEDRDAVVSGVRGWRV